MYTTSRKVGMSKETIPWINKAAVIFWNSTHGETLTLLEREHEKQIKETEKNIKKFEHIQQQLEKVLGKSQVVELLNRIEEKKKIEGKKKSV